MAKLDIKVFEEDGPSNLVDKFSTMEENSIKKD
jgi:hypothetical protein